MTVATAGIMVTDMSMVGVMLCWDDASKPAGIAQAHVRLAAVPAPGFQVSVIATPIGATPPARVAVVKTTTLFTLGEDLGIVAMCEVEWV